MKAVGCRLLALTDSLNVRRNNPESRSKVKDCKMGGVMSLRTSDAINAFEDDISISGLLKVSLVNPGLIARKVSSLFVPMSGLPLIILTSKIRRVRLNSLEGNMVDGVPPVKLTISVDEESTRVDCKMTLVGSRNSVRTTSENCN